VFKSITLGALVTGEFPSINVPRQNTGRTRSSRLLVTRSRDQLLDSSPFPGNSTSSAWTFAPLGDLNKTPLEYGNGAIASGAPVQLIFWGSSWTLPNTDPSAVEFIAAVQTILGGPFQSGLRQYGVKPSFYRGAKIVTAPDPPAQYSPGDITDMVWSLIDDGHFPEPDEDGGRIVYIVVMPPNTLQKDLGDSGAHSAPTDVDFLDIDYAWVGYVYNSTLDDMTSVFCHELVETLTDPEPYGGWHTEPHADGQGEIGDLCFLWTVKHEGINYQAYYSKLDSECIVPVAYSLRRFVSSMGINPATGLRQFGPADGRLRAWISS
jgi:hypothetical protein